MTKICLLGLLIAASAPAQVRLDDLDRLMAGPRTRVAVLGTVHLQEMKADLGPKELQPVLDRLTAYHPDVITIESISGKGCKSMEQQADGREPASSNPYCSDPSAARAATGLDVAAATAQVDRVLKNWPKSPSATQRRHLAALFLASNDQASALVQWLQLDDTQRHAGDGLNPALVDTLRRDASARDEGYLIAARLAARLGLQRVFPVDDHTGDDIQVDDAGAFSAAVQSAWSGEVALAGPLRDHVTSLENEADMLGVYRYINTPAYLQATVDEDFGAALRDPSPRHYGQMYVAGWETRNLRMVANVREVLRERPGVRVLCIVGATHKPWFDQLLGQMQGIDIVDVGEVLE